VLGQSAAVHGDDQAVDGALALIDFHGRRPPDCPLPANSEVSCAEEMLQLLEEAIGGRFMFTLAAA
jgi:hypothetical protein